MDHRGNTRYAAHEALSGFTAQTQHRLAQSQIAVVGAGGIGSTALLYLAASGVGLLSVIDGDVVATSNLARQVIHREGSVGQPKVASATETLTALNSTVTSITHNTRLDASNAADLLAGHTVVIDASDNFATRYLINDTCRELQIPVVWGSVWQTNAQVAVWHAPPPHPRLDLRDAFPVPPDAADEPCADAGVWGPLCGQVGCLLATAALRLAGRFGPALPAGITYLDAWTGRHTQIPVTAPLQ